MRRRSDNATPLGERALRIADPHPSTIAPPGYDQGWFDSFRARIDELVRRVDRGGARHRRARMRLLGARAAAIGDAVALDAVVRLAGAPLDLSAVDVTPLRRRTSPIIPTTWPREWPVQTSLTASGRATRRAGLRRRNALRAAATHRKPVPAYYGGSGRYRVRPREGLILTASGEPAVDVKFDPRRWWRLVPTGDRGALVSSSAVDVSEPTGDQLDAALAALQAIANRPPPPIYLNLHQAPVEMHLPEQAAPVVHVHLPEQKQHPTVAVPIRDEDGKILRVEHRPVDDGDDV
jgi:hypothetical protein